MPRAMRRFASSSGKTSERGKSLGNGLELIARGETTPERLLRRLSQQLRREAIASAVIQ